LQNFNSLHTGASTPASEMYLLQDALPAPCFLLPGQPCTEESIMPEVPYEIIEDADWRDCHCRM